RWHLPCANLLRRAGAGEDMHRDVKEIAGAAAEANVDHHVCARAADAPARLRSVNSEQEEPRFVVRRIQQSVEPPLDDRCRKAEYFKALGYDPCLASTAIGGTRQ